MSRFVNRVAQLASLEQWWNGPGTIAAVAGRRRVGKTWLADQFARGRPTVVHRGAGRGDQGELHHLACTLADDPAGPVAAPDGPFAGWPDALDHFEAQARDTGPLLLVLDNTSGLFTPSLSDALTGLAARSGARSGRRKGALRSPPVKVLLCTSSVRQIRGVKPSGGALADVVDELVLVEPFSPSEVGAMLPSLSPADRARVYGIVGGSPLYLSWWDAGVSIEENLAELVCRPAARLMVEGDLLLEAELEEVGFHDRVLHGLAEGNTSYNSVRSWAGTEPARPLDRLIELGFIERVLPVGENSRVRRRRYRIVDPFVQFYLQVMCRHRAEIDCGRGEALARRVGEEAETLMPEVWQESFRAHLAGLSEAGQLPVRAPATAVGPWWDSTGRAEIDALALDDGGAPVLAGVATWQPVMNGMEDLAHLRSQVARGLGAYPDRLRFALCARDEVVGVPYDALVYTAADLFDG